MQPSQPERLPPRQQWVAEDKWPIVGERTAERPSDPWSLTITGGRVAARTWTLDDLWRLPATDISLDLHCVTRWSKRDVRFGGVRLMSLLEEIGVDESRRFASFMARSERNHSTSLPIADLADLDPLIALSVGSEPIPADHGGPIRLIVPRRYLYKSVKWLERIELLGEDRLGTWESEAGYHNHADPWREERFVASGLSKREAAALIEAKDFRGRDLRGLDGRGRRLDGLQASASALRDADLRDASMVGADFRDANLSGARLGRADLQQAVFDGADLEGCDFAGADLRGASFRGASLFGATFCDTEANSKAIPVRLGPSFPFDSDQLDMLIEAQRQFLLAMQLET